MDSKEELAQPVANAKIRGSLCFVEPVRLGIAHNRLSLPVIQAGFQRAGPHHHMEIVAAESER